MSGDDPAAVEGSSSPEDAFAAFGEALADAVAAVLGDWVLRCVSTRWRDYHGRDADAALAERARLAGELATGEVLVALRSLLAQDAEAQRTNPLAVLRRATRYPTDVLRAAGVPAVVRDAYAEANFPDDLYDLTPAAFADIDPSLHEPGLLWGAAKAHVILRRRTRH